MYTDQFEAGFKVGDTIAFYTGVGNSGHVASCSIQSHQYHELVLHVWAVQSVLA